MSFWGNAVLILAFVVALYSMVSALVDSRKNKYGFPTSARYCVFAVAGLLTLAEGLLLGALVSHNFSLQYVADYSSRSTPLAYLITGLWAGNAGAILFWAWIIALSAAWLLWRSNKTNKELMPNAVAAVLFTELLFLVLLFVVSPFKASAVVPVDGAGLKPVLQNIGMIFHPPLLLAGYALFTVPFALAVAALFNRDADDSWVITAKRWALVAWLLLGLGNVLGMWWAYAELGWGGYWAWDPVENAGLMPWLLITAFLHSGMMYLRRGMFKLWTAILAIAAFWLTIFGAFLTRTNVAGSVHTFGQTPMTPAFIIFLLVVLIGSVWLLINRRDFFKSQEGDDALVSGTGTFLAVNLLFVISTVFILFGTVLPFFTQASPAKSYFNITNLPVFVTLILLAGFCVLVGWKKPDMRQFNRQLLWPALGGVIAIIAAVIAGWTRWYVLLPFFVLGAVAVATLYRWMSDVAARMRGKKEGFFSAFGRLFIANRSRYGGYIIHIAIVVMTLGIVGSSVYKMTPSAIAEPYASATVITMNGDKWLTAQFVAKSVSVDILVKGMGSVTPAVGKHSYSVGSIVTMIAIPAVGWEFTGWTGSVSDPQATIATLNVSDETTITANFVQSTKPQYLLTVQTADSNKGSVTPLLSQYKYAAGTVVSIIAVPEDGYKFTLWTGDVTDNNAAITSVVMDGDKVITANFDEAVQYVLNVKTSGSGVVSPSVGDHSYAENTQVTLTAVADPGWQFAGWSGDVADVLSTSTTITINQRESIIAKFTEITQENQHVLTVGVIGNGSATPGVGSHSYDAGSDVPIAAIPASGWVFVGWTETALRQGERITFGDYTMTFGGLIPETTDTQMTVSAELVISRHGKLIAELYPLQFYSLPYSSVSESWFSKVAIKSNLAEDLYVRLDGWDNGLAYISVTLNPLVQWIWIGGFLLLLGGLVSFSAAPRKIPSADTN